MLVLVLTAMDDFAANATSNAAHCYQQIVPDYHNYLDQNFDGSINSPGPLAHIFLSSKVNNEVHTLKEIPREPDRDKLIEAMEQEVRSMFDEKILEAVLKQLMRDHYDKIGKQDRTSNDNRS